LNLDSGTTDGLFLERVNKLDNKFILKSFNFKVKDASDDEIKNLIADIIADLFHEAGFESLARYKLVLEAVVIELDRELDSLRPQQSGDPVDELGL